MKTKLDHSAPELLAQAEAESDNEMEVEIEVEILDSMDEDTILDGIIPNEVKGNAGTEIIVSGTGATPTEHDSSTQPAHPVVFVVPVLPTAEERLHSLIAALGPGPSISIAAQFAYFNGTPYPNVTMDFSEVENDYAHTSSEAGILTGRIPSMAHNVGQSRESTYQASNSNPADILPYVGYSIVVDLNATVYQLTKLSNSNLGLGDETIRPTFGTSVSIAQSDEERKKLWRRLLIIFIRLHGQLQDFLDSVGQNLSTDLRAIMNECYDALTLEGPPTEVSQRRMQNALSSLIIFIQDQLQRFWRGQSAKAPAIGYTW